MSKRKSAVYDCFRETETSYECIVKVEENNECGIKVTKLKSGGAASNMKRHFGRVHPEEF